ARALAAGRAWLAGTGLDRRPRDIPPVFGHGDGNLANYLWDGVRVRIVDFEDSGHSDRAFELAEIVEHVSAWAERALAAEDFLARFDLGAAERRRLGECRRLNALAWLRILWHDPAALRRQAERLLAALG